LSYNFKSVHVGINQSSPSGDIKDETSETSQKCGETLAKLPSLEVCMSYLSML